MKRVSVAFAVVCVSASALLAQTGLPPRPPVPAEPLPPMHIPQDVIVETLPNGMTISRPLTPVADPTAPPQPGVTKAVDRRTPVLQIGAVRRLSAPIPVKTPPTARYPTPDEGRAPSRSDGYSGAAAPAGGGGAGASD